MKTRITIETFSALSFGVPLKEVRPNGEKSETRILATRFRMDGGAGVQGVVLRRLSGQSPASVPRPGDDGALELICEAFGLHRPLAWECWLVKQPLAPEGLPFVLAPLAGRSPRPASGPIFCRV